MTKYGLGLSADKRTAYLAVKPQALPGAATQVLPDVDYGGPLGRVDKNPKNHTLFHVVQEALYRVGILDMQRVSIVKHGTIWNSTSVTAAAVPNLSRAANATSTIVLTYQPSGQVAQNSQFTFTSSDPSKASVSAAGVITALNVGAVTITAVQDDLNLSVQIPVTIVA